jgi:hypothetical protein
MQADAKIAPSVEHPIIDSQFPRKNVQDTGEWKLEAHRQGNLNYPIDLDVERPMVTSRHHECLSALRGANA